MKIAVLASGVLKKEVKQKSIASEVNIVWADSINELVEIAGAKAYFDFDFFYEKERIGLLRESLPAPVFINSIVNTLNEVSRDFIRINAWPGFLSRSICEISVASDEQKKNAEKIFEQLKWDYRFAPDVPGMVSARILAMIINEAYYTLQDNVSTKEEIDIAMKLGTNYPYGPFEWSQKIGLKNIYDLLAELSKTESRYQASGLLEEEAIKKS